MNKELDIMNDDNEKTAIDLFNNHLIAVSEVAENVRIIADKYRDDLGDAFVKSTVGVVLIAISSFLPPPWGGLVGATGGVLSTSVIGRRVNNALEIIDTFLSQVAELKDKIDPDKLVSEDYQFLLSKSLKAWLGDQRKEKAQFYQNLLINHLISESYDINGDEIYLEMLDDLSFLELYILSFFDMEEYLKRKSESFAAIITMKTCDLFENNTCFSDQEIYLAFESLSNKKFINGHISFDTIEEKRTVTFDAFGIIPNLLKRITEINTEEI